jgi:hypothetical protein
MKILYVSDSYAFNVYGTKRSIYEGTNDLGHEATWINIGKKGDLLSIIKDISPDQLWLAHSGLVLSGNMKSQISIPVVGFGFSDPYYFSPSRFDSYDAYVTNHIGTFNKYKSNLPMCYNMTACDFKFHKKLPLEKSIDISVIGLAVHPRFHNKRERIDIVNKLRANKFTVYCYGKGWPDHPHNFGHIDGDNLLKVINQSKIGLDIQDDFSPLAHRMMEYAACGVPIITRARPEVSDCFSIGTEMLTYTSQGEIMSHLNKHLNSDKFLADMGKSARKRCVRQHNVDQRVDNILKFTSKIR